MTDANADRTVAWRLVEKLARLGAPYVKVAAPANQQLNENFWDCPPDHVLYHDGNDNCITVGDCRDAAAVLKARALPQHQRSEGGT